MPETGIRKKKMNIIKKAWELFVLLLTGKSEEAVDAGICDYSGQGKDKYGD